MAKQRKRGTRHGASKPPEKPAGPKKTVLGPGAFAAAELHEQRLKNMGLRKEILQKDALILKLQTIVVKKDELLLAQEEKDLEGYNTTLREKHNLRLGETLHRDDDTQEIFYLDKEDSSEGGHEDHKEGDSASVESKEKEEAKV